MKSGELVFTQAALLDLLTQIDELKDYDISILDGVAPTVFIGNSQYNISNVNIENIQVDEKTLNKVETINDETFDEIIDSDESLDSINSGIIGNIAKTLLVGGLVRLTKKLLD